MAPASLGGLKNGSHGALGGGASWQCGAGAGSIVTRNEIQRSHYTLDVWVSWYTTPMVWICFYFFFPNDPVKHIFFWKDQPQRVYLPRDREVPQEEQVATSFGSPTAIVWPGIGPNMTKE
mmetsp:Transcript_10546/g.8791  ORF Transcript_10546/g.8791 Transcript_10546/m.8791 type:complete len:120 (+) Transcript_10546:61-420(+)